MIFALLFKGDAGQLTSESPSKMPGASVPLSLSPVLQSHSRPSTSSAMPSPVGERIDLSIPLDQQGLVMQSFSLQM